MSDSLTTIAAVASPMEAQFIKDRLAQADIPAFIVGEHTHGLQFRSIAPFAGDIRIQVPSALVDDACAILADDGEELPEGSLLVGEELMEEFAGEEASADPVCPHCGSDLIGKRDRPLWLLMISVLLIGLPLLFAPSRSQCRSCGALL